MTRAGSDRVLETFCEMFPQATVFATLFRPEGFRGSVLEKRRIHTSPLQHFPRSHEWYRSYLPFMPFAVRSHNLESFDVVLSSSHAAAKGVRVREDQLHLCYCYTPARYLWDMEGDYLDRALVGRGPLRVVSRALIQMLRAWDRKTARGVDHFMAISEFTRDRIRRFYERDAEVIPPPCEVTHLPLVSAKENYFVTVSRLVPYKRVDLLVRAFSQLRRRLVVIGDGPQLDSLRKMAGPSVRFASWVSDRERIDLVSKARAFLFAAEEDFGIAPVEAQAMGTPIIGYGRGGLRDTVVDRETGIFFYDRSEEGITDAVRQFEKIERSFQPAVLRQNAERFSTERFRTRFRDAFDREVARFNPRART